MVFHPRCNIFPHTHIKLNHITFQDPKCLLTPSQCSKECPWLETREERGFTFVLNVNAAQLRDSLCSSPPSIRLTAELC